MKSLMRLFERNKFEEAMRDLSLTFGRSDVSRVHHAIHIGSIGVKRYELLILQLFISRRKRAVH